MKIKYLFILFAFLIISCKAQKKAKQCDKGINKDAFEILDIETIGKVNVFYAMKADSIYKIASEQSNIDCSEIIIRKNFYNFKLESVFLDNFHQKYDITGIDFNGEIIKLEGGDTIWDLFVSPNIDGKCYIK